MDDDTRHFVRTTVLVMLFGVVPGLLLFVVVVLLDRMFDLATLTYYRGPTGAMALSGAVLGFGFIRFAERAFGYTGKDLLLSLVGSSLFAYWTTYLLARFLLGLDGGDVSAIIGIAVGLLLGVCVFEVYMENH